MSKQVSKGAKSRKKLLNGVNIVADAVKVTLGARGRNVVIEDDYGSPLITKDGVTVADSIDLEDSIENLGASLVKEAAQKTVKISGDGTTTCTVLVQAIAKDGIKSIETGFDPISVKKGIEIATECVVKHLKKISKPVNDHDTLINIASISANNDLEIGKIIADAVKKVGDDGVITLEPSNTNETSVTITDGMKIDKGFISPSFVNNDAKMETEFANPAIIVYDKRISNFKELIPMLEKLLPKQCPVLMICEDMDGEALGTMILNNTNKKIQFCAIRTPNFGIQREQCLDDICTVTGATLITEKKGLSLDNIDLSHVGGCEKLIVGSDSTIIVKGYGSKKSVEEKSANIKSNIGKMKSEYEQIFAKQRIATMNGCIGVIRVGGVTETEIKESMARFDDSLRATQSAIEEGFVSGGGTAYLSAIKSLDKLQVDDESQMEGIKIVKKAILAPFKQILSNGGIEASEFISKLSEMPYGFGYNIKTNVIEDFFKTGVIDPTKVVRVSLENGASIGGILLTTECVISNKI